MRAFEFFGLRAYRHVVAAPNTRGVLVTPKFGPQRNRISIHFLSWAGVIIHRTRQLKHYFDNEECYFSLCLRCLGYPASLLIARCAPQPAIHPKGETLILYIILTARMWADSVGNYLELKAF